jgi:WD40-like Beta Propeller Repeat
VIAYDPTSEQNSLWVTDLDGSGALVATPVAPAAPAWAPDGRWIAFTRAQAAPDPHPWIRGPRPANEALWLVRADGSGLHVLRENTTDPAWAPDGSRLSAVLTDGGEPGGSAPRHVSLGDLGELGLVDLDGRTTPLGVLADGASAWSPDGRTLGFPALSGFGSGVELVGADGSSSRSLALGCLPPNPPRLFSCAGGASVPVEEARGPFDVRVNALPSGRASIRLQLALRDSRHYRVRGARLHVLVRPLRSVEVKLLSSATDFQGMFYVDVLPHGRQWPNASRLELRFVGRNGELLERRALRCRDVTFLRFWADATRCQRRV